MCLRELHTGIAITQQNATPHFAPLGRRTDPVCNFEGLIFVVPVVATTRVAHVGTVVSVT